MSPFKFRINRCAMPGPADLNTPSKYCVGTSKFIGGQAQSSMLILFLAQCAYRQAPAEWREIQALADSEGNRLLYHRPRIDLPLKMAPHDLAGG